MSPPSKNLGSLAAAVGLSALLLARAGWSLPLDAHLGFPSFPAVEPSDDPPAAIEVKLSSEGLQKDPVCGGACVPDCTPELAAKLQASCAAVYGDYAVFADTDSEWHLMSVDQAGRWVWYNPTKQKFKEKFRSSAVSAAMEPRLEKIWGHHAEPLPKTLSFVPWRLLVRPLLSSVVTGATAQRTLNTGRGLMKYVAALRGNHNAGKQAGFFEADGLLNVGGVLNNAIDDVASVVKSPFFAGAALSNRIQVCYANLQAVTSDRLTVKHFLDPELHVGVRIDDGLYESDDPAVTIRHLAKAMEQGGVFCHRVPLVRGESESLAIERLRCADSLYQPGWGPVFYNCGGYTADILKLAGLGYPGLPNAGIGYRNSVSRARHKQFIYVKKVCGERIEAVRRALNAAERGEDLRAQAVPATLPNSGADVRWQLIVSAARAGAAGNRAWVTANVSEADFAATYLDALDRSKLNPKTRAFIRQTARGLPPSALGWIKEKFPESAGILALSAQAP